MNILSIGQVARRAGVGVETVRYYEREGLLEEPPRRASGYRQYSEQVVKRLHFIKRAQKLGFSLKEITELLQLRVDAQTACEEVRQHAEAKIAEVDRKLIELQRMRQALIRWPRYAQDEDQEVPALCLMRSTSRKRLIKPNVMRSEQRQ